MKKYRKRVFRVISVVLMSVLMMSLMACGSEEKENSTSVAVKETKNPQESADETAAPDDTEEANHESTPESDSEKDSGILIAYFSWSGNSKSEAELIQEKTGGTLFEIVREEPYPEDYTECTEVAKKEKEDNERPSIKNPPESLDEYDKIVVCYPIWWHTAPMTVGTFLECYDLAGKTIYPVSQSASMVRSQYEESVAFIKGCAKGATVDAGIFSKDDAVISNYINEKVLK